MSAARWIVTGTATVSVYLDVEADTAEEARKLAGEAMNGEWTCDDVDGDVAIVDEPKREDSL